MIKDGEENVGQDQQLISDFSHSFQERSMGQVVDLV
jgi:hypothetical protein